MHALADSRDAFAARLALADAAQRSLDVQYYIWHKDMTGSVLIERLLRAADRGVRVRLLLDDIGTMPSDDVLLTIDSHPNIEVRMFNPVALRSPRMLGMVADFGRINRRMHNKSFIADGQVAIVGGRNIGDEYYGTSAGANFADLDLAVIGPVVNEVADAFDLYWNHRPRSPSPNFRGRGRPRSKTRRNGRRSTSATRPRNSRPMRTACARASSRGSFATARSRIPGGGPRS